MIAALLLSPLTPLEHLLRHVLDWLHVTIGLAAFPTHGNNDVDLLRAADQAMYVSKVSGRNKVSLPLSDSRMVDDAYYGKVLPSLDRQLGLAGLRLAHFLNDAYGSSAGDRTLVGVATAVGESIRNVDTPVRMGGDEFCVLLPHQTASRARVLAERLASAIEEVDNPASQPLGVAIGVVSCPQHATDADGLLEIADGAMYRAKAAGERVAVGTDAASQNGDLIED